MSHPSTDFNSLGFAKPPRETRVVVAMSGGVDSSVTAALLAGQDYDVIGITLQLYDHGEATARPGSCCAGRDIYDAKKVAAEIGIPHYVLNYESRFRQDVMDDFVESYARGETPIPCVRCNQTVKFRDLVAQARDLGADALATGHYVRRQTDGTGMSALYRGADRGRDQSYFLFATTRAQLDFLRFPLGDLDKSGTRALARKYKLPVSEKPDSQDICFVPQGGYAELVKKLKPESQESGDIVDESGQVLGRHEGIIHFTIGQRRGLNLGLSKTSNSEPLYVLRLEPETRRVVVGPPSALSRDSFPISGVNWLGEGEAMPAQGLRAQVKLRSAQEPLKAFIRPCDKGRAEVRLDEPQGAVAPGQACVFYDGERLLGGGWIERH